MHGALVSSARWAGPWPARLGPGPGLLPRLNHPPREEESLAKLFARPGNMFGLAFNFCFFLSGSDSLHQIGEEEALAMSPPEWLTAVVA